MLVICVFILLIRNSVQTLTNFQSTCAELYPVKAKHVIILLIDIHSDRVDETNVCHNLLKDALTDIFQIQMSIDKMNENRRNIEGDFGVLICDACSDEYLSKIAFANSIAKVAESDLNLIAIFTSITSQSFYEINKMFKEYNLKVPIITYSSSVSKLVEITKNQSIQILPNDKYKIEVGL